MSNTESAKSAVELCETGRDIAYQAGPIPPGSKIVDKETRLPNGETVLLAHSTDDRRAPRTIR